jgi:gamma-glutamyltranspeptidase/glutathione hydrolase
MDDFSAKPGVPNRFELIQGPANAIGPGKRPLSAMAPTIVLKDGKLFLVLGSQGGPRIITTVGNILMGVVDYGMNLQQAVNAPRFHHQWLPDVTRVEQEFSSASARRLKAMGHNLEPATEETGVRARYWSDAECIALDLKTGERLGASDKRNHGKAIGF